jgi:OTU-like cysteine protease
MLSQLLLNASKDKVGNDYSPRSIVGDGNCFYRAVSLALYGTQDMHDYLRLKTCNEILEHRELYDEQSETFVLRGQPVLTPTFHVVLQSVLLTGRYAELVHLFALSAAMRLTIQSYRCSTPYMGQELHPLTMVINGD